MATLVRIHKALKEGKLDNITPSQSKSVVKGARGAKKGAVRGPYKKRQSTGSEGQEVEIEAEDDALAHLGEASIDASDVQAAVEEDEEHQDEGQEEHVITESI